MPFRKAKFVGLDGTGFEVENRSMHYQLRTARSTYRRYIKLGISADLEKQIILRQTFNKSPRNDCKDFMFLTKDIKTDYLCADKGYDSENNHKFVIKDLKAKSFISIRNYGNKRIPRNKRKYRNQAKREFDEKRYHQRSKVETIFSVIKRKYGSYLKARTFYSQKKEGIFRLVAYNVDRLCKLIYIIFRVSAKPG